MNVLWEVQVKWKSSLILLVGWSLTGPESYLKWNYYFHQTFCFIMIHNPWNLSSKHRYYSISVLCEENHYSLIIEVLPVPQIPLGPNKWTVASPWLLRRSGEFHRVDASLEIFPLLVKLFILQIFHLPFWPVFPLVLWCSLVNLHTYKVLRLYTRPSFIFSLRSLCKLPPLIPFL